MKKWLKNLIDSVLEDNKIICKIYHIGELSVQSEFKAFAPPPVGTYIFRHGKVEHIFLTLLGDDSYYSIITKEDG